MKYYELETVNRNNKIVCIFGAGHVGKTWGYDLITLAGHTVKFFFDNKTPAGTVIRGNVKIASLEKLYSMQDNVLVFVAVVKSGYQKEIVEQLQAQGVQNFIIIDYLFLQEFIGSVLQSDDNALKERYKAIVEDKEFLKRQFGFRLGYPLNLDNPRSFNEKLQWLKLYDHNPLYTQLVDKYTVKKWVAEKIGEEYVIPPLGVWNCFDDIEFDKLPEQFVLKCTHDSGSTIVVTDKKEINVLQVRKCLEQARQFNYFWAGREWPYKNVSRRIFAEKYMEDSTKDELIDYKFLCSQGKVICIFVYSERFKKSGLKATFFDLHWNKLPFTRHYPNSAIPIPRPYNLEQMVAMAEKLSQDIPTVRVDFYEMDRKVYFGEMTFYPGGGMEEFEPVEWDYRLGEMIELDNYKK